MKVQIIHNNRCSKSRTALNLLTENGIEPEVIKYLDNPLTKDELREVLKKLDVPAFQIIREGEAVFKENFKGKDLSEEEWIDAMVSYPKLIERPIIVKGDKAVVGRPPENVLDLIQ